MLELSVEARAHFEQPRHVGSLEAGARDVAQACVGEPVSGDILYIGLQVNTDGLIIAARFKAYGCGWLIACGSLLTECCEGRTLEALGHFRHHELVEKLNLPPAKLHCAVLAETALKTALRALAAKAALADNPASS